MGKTRRKFTYAYKAKAVAKRYKITTIAQRVHAKGRLDVLGFGG